MWCFFHPDTLKEHAAAELSHSGLSSEESFERGMLSQEGSTKTKHAHLGTLLPVPDKLCERGGRGG